MCNDYKQLVMQAIISVETICNIMKIDFRVKVESR